VSALIGLSAWIMRNRAVHEEHVRATAEAEAVAASHMRATAQYRAEEEALIRATAVQEAQIQKEIAEEEREIAVSRQLAAEAWRESEQLDLALLLSLEASHIRDTREARSSLLKGLIQFSHLETIWHTSAEGVIKFLSTSPRSKTSVVQNGGQLMVWDGEQRTLRELKGVSMDESVEDIAVHADGSVSLIALDGLLYRWTADNPNPDTVPWGNPEGLEGLGFARLSPDGTMIAAVQGDTVTIWDAGDGSLLGEPMTKTGTMITELCFSPDGTALAVGYHNPEEMTGEAVIWDLTSREIEGPPFPLWSSEQVVLKLAFSPDGSVLYTGTDDVEDEEDDTTGNGRFWDVQSREHLTWSAFPLGDTEVVFSENGQRAAIQQGTTIRLWERKGSGYYLIDEFDAPSPDGGVALTPEGERLFTGSADGKVYVWAFKETETIIQQPLQDAHNCLYFAFNPDGGTLFADCWLQGPRIWDVDSGECLDHHEQVIEYPEDTHDEEPSAAAYSPDGSRIASGYVGGDVVLWNPDSLEPARDPLQGCGGEIHELAFSPDGRWLAAVSHEFSGSVLVFWRAEDGEHMLTLGEEDRFGQGEWLRFNSLAFSPIEDRLVVAGRYVLEDSTAVHGLWFIDGIRSYLAGESESFTVEKVLDDLPIAHLAFHPDGTVLAAASGGDEKVHFFDADTMEEIGFLYHGHEYSIESLALSPQGRLMASGGGDSTIADIGETIQLWDLNTKQPIGPRLPGEGLNMVYDLAFSPDGSKLASYSGNSDLVIWDVSLESWRRYACQMANRNLTDQEWTMYLGDRPYRQTCGSDPGLAP
ncbi:MAG: WD40 repeat domain-containing protein, partial [Chloroflexota bacterium]